MKKFQFTALIFTLFVAFFAVSCAGAKGEAEKTIDSYVELLKAKNFAKAWEMLSGRLALHSGLRDSYSATSAPTPALSGESAAARQKAGPSAMRSRSDSLRLSISSTRSSIVPAATKR